MSGDEGGHTPIALNDSMSGIESSEQHNQHHEMLDGFDGKIFATSIYFNQTKDCSVSQEQIQRIFHCYEHFKIHQNASKFKQQTYKTQFHFKNK